jgi:coenzyme F420-0:L-glutamate ligase/coenzyme F420-1:gamma-L-glutamate ligase
LSVEAHVVPGIGEVTSGDDLGAVIGEALALAPCGPPAEGDVVVTAQKIVSKAEGMMVDLATIDPSPEAQRLAAEGGRDPRHVQVVLDEAAEVLRPGPWAIICETRHGFVCANAGVDASNVPGSDRVLLLPRDPDGSARRLRAALCARFGLDRLAVVVTDSFGRAWRTGQCDVAIGCAGLSAVWDERGRADREGRPLTATEIAVADEIAAAADLARSGKAGGEPVILIRGCGKFVLKSDGAGAAALVRERSRDMFR